jgi:S1-C subfamily serine protease
MKLKTALVAAMILPVLAVFPAAAQDEAPAAPAAPPATQKAPETDWSALMDSKAPSIVSIKFVLNMQISRSGQMMMDQESNSEVRGVLISATGLVLTANEHFDPERALLARIPPQGRAELKIKARPSELKVLFGNEEDEFEGQILARDSNLGVAFVQVLGLADREVAPLDLAASGELAVGKELFGVSRLPRGFDCAPTIGRLFVSAKVEKPRTMWAVTGNFSGVGLPVFDLESRPVGVLSMQKGSEGVDEGGMGGGGMRPFVIPISTLKRTMKAAETRAAEALAEAKKKAEEEKAEEGAEKDEGEEGEAEEKDDAPEKETPEEDKPEKNG